MSFFRRSHHSRHNRDHLLLWLGIAALAVIIYIFFFAPVKKLELEIPPSSPARQKIVTAAPPEAPAAATPTPLPKAGETAVLPEYRAWMSTMENDVGGSPPAPPVSFFPNEKIYLHVTFPHLAAGTARVNVNWISPAGKQSNSAEQVIGQATPGAANVHFWLSFTANGAVTEMFTGKEFKPAVYGGWQAQVFFNGEPLTTVLFLVHE